MRKFTLVIAVILLAILVISLTACGTVGSGSGTKNIYGKYYEYENGTKNPDSYVELKRGNKWTDGTDSGEFTIDGSSITLLSDGEEFLTGTVENGVLSLELWGMPFATYYKDGAYPSNSGSGSGGGSGSGSGGGSVEPPTPGQEDGLVRFDANGGEVSITQKRYEIGTVMTDMPIPTREGYDFVGWETADGVSYTSASVMPDLDGETLYLYAEWEKIVSTYSDNYVQFTPAVKGLKNEEDYYLYYYDKVDEYIYVELDIDYVGYGNAGEINNFRLGNYENLMFNTKEGYSLTWYTDAEFSKINGAQIFTLNYGSNIHFLTVSSQGTVRKTYLVDFYLLRDYYISLSDHIDGEPYTRVRVDEGGTFDKNYEWRWADKFEGDKRVYYNTSTEQYERFDYSTIINQDWTLYQTYKSKSVTYLNADGESKTLKIKPFEDVDLSTPSKDGHTFIGWQQPDKKMFTDIDGESRLQLTGDNYFETLTPIWKENVFEKIDTVNNTKFKVVTPTVFYDNNGELYKLVYYTQDNEICYAEQYSIKITYDLTSKGGSFDEFYTTTLTCPDVPSRFYGTVSSYTTYYYFNGWYTQETGGQKFDFTAPIYGDVTLYARWSTYDRTDTYANEPSGGQCHIPEPTKTDKGYFCGDEVTLTAMENPGYTWVGWYDGNTELTTEESYKVTVSAGNKAYTAKWTAYYVTAEKNIDDAGYIYIDGVKAGGTGSITFNLNGGSGTAPATQSSGTATYPTTIPTRSGYVFAGWYDNQSCTGSPYDFTEDVTEDTILYAKWISYSGTGVLTLNSSKSISVVSKGSSTYHYYAFVPLTSGQITVYTTGSLDTYGYLYNSSKSQLTYNDDGNGNGDFKITYNVTAGTLYYVRPCGYSNSGTTTIHLEGALPEEGGEILNAPSTKMITAGESVTLTATSNPGYTWLGWYDGDTKVSEGTSLTYTFTMPAESKTYTAKWMECPVTLEKNIPGAGTVSFDRPTAVGAQTTITATTNPGYTWLGWFDGDAKVSSDTTYTFTMPTESKTYTAKWACYTVSTETNLEGAGSYTNYTEKKVAFGETVELVATTNPGYTWLGWYDGGVKVSEGTSLTYTFTMPAGGKIYTAKWACYTVSTETNLNGAGTYTRKTNTKVTVGESVTLTAATNSGYTWLGWYDGETLVCEDTTYTFTMPAESKTYTAKWACYTISTETNLDEAGTYTVKTEEKVPVGETIELTATTNPGYTWLGWYDGGVLVCEYTSYTLTMPAESKTYTAKWAEYYVTVEKNMDDAGDVYRDGEKIYSGSISFNLNGGSGTAPATQSSGTATYPTTIPTRSDYIFAGWYDNQQCIGSPYDFTADVTEDITLYAKWISYSGTNVLALNSSKFISVSSGTLCTYAFVPLTDGQISVYSTGSHEYGYLLDSSLTQLEEDGSLGDRDSFGIVYNVTAGTLYYVRLGRYSGTGTTTIYLQGDLPEDGGDILIGSPSTKMITAGESATLTATTNLGYTWLGWYDGDTKVSKDLTYTFTMSAGSKTYTAKWMECPVTLEKNIPEAGTVSGVSGATVVGGETTITATTNPGYTWLGWYDGETLVCEDTTYTFTMPAESKKYTAKWACYTITTETNLEGAGTYTIKTNEKVAVGEIVELTAATNTGYTWLGWYDGDTKVSEGTSLTYTFTMPAESKTYTAKWSKVTLAKTPSGAGSVTSLTGRYNVGDEVAVTATTNLGYTWLGWYDGDTKVSEGTNLTYTFTMPAENKTYTAKWSKVTITRNNSSAGSVSSLGGKTYVEGEEVTVTATANLGYTWLGWYDGDTKVSEGTNMTYTFTMLAENKTYTAKWEIAAEMRNFNFTSTSTSCTITGIKDKTVTSIVVPDYVTEISAGAFSGCSSLESITIPFVGATLDGTSNTHIGYLFGESNSNLINAKVPGSLNEVVITGGTSIGSSAFYYCRSLTSITIHASVTSIGSYAFYECTNLISVTFGENSQLTSIGSYAFEYCSSLTSITIPASVTSIGEWAFYRCTNLTSVTFEENSQLTTIGSYAFRDCSSLTSITIPDSVTTIGSSAFEYCTSLTSITLPFVGATKDGIENTHFGYIFGESSNSNYKNGKVPSSLEVVVITGGTSIGSYAFDMCSNITSVSIPDSVTSIGVYAFYNCGLTSITIPDSVTTIGDSAFGSCDNLAYNIYDNAKYLGNETNPYLVLVKATSTDITSCEINENCKVICGKAFYNCDSLAIIYIPDSVTSIGAYAFGACSILQTVRFKDTSTWYRADSFTNWSNKTGGTLTTMTDISTNAKYFTSSYSGHYWYKL